MRTGRSRARAATLAAAATALAAVLLGAGTAPATRLLSDQRQLSANTQPLGIFNAEAAYNSKNRRWLVAYAADVGGGKTDVFAQMLTDLGEPIGGPIRATVSEGTASAFFPAVAYSRKTNSFLIAFGSEGIVGPDKEEIFARRVSGSGDLLGTPFRVSEMGADDDAATGSPGPPALAYNDDDNHYLVAWGGDDVDQEFEVFGQRVGATGNRIGPEIALSATPGDQRNAVEPAVAYSGDGNEYLVVWRDNGFGALDETDIFGQRVNAAGVPVGADDFRISATGTDSSPDFGATQPSVAADGLKGEYMVAFSAALIPSGELEIKVQRLDRDGAQIGADDQRITDAGPEGDEDRNAIAPSISFNAPARQYLVAYAADEVGVDEKFEIHAQRLSRNGEERGENDLRVSLLGADTIPGVGAASQFRPATVAANNQLSEWLVAYWGAASAAEIFNSFSRVVGLSGNCGGRTARVGGPGRDLIRLGTGRDVVAGRGGRDNIRTGAGKDRICGGKGKDRLFGGKGRDRLIGGKGRDRCVGGRGRDRAKGCESRSGL